MSSLLGTVNLFSKPRWQGCGVVCHAQVVEDEASAEAARTHHLGDGLCGFLEGLEDAHREATQTGDVLRAVAGTDAAAILMVVPVDDVMDAFDAPMQGQRTKTP